jgi:hypothetical protein
MVQVTDMNKMEAFMFAAINPKTGRLRYSRTYLTYGLAGVALSELHRQGKLDWDGRNVKATAKGSAGEELLDEMMGLIRKKEKPCGLRTLISTVPYRLRRFSGRVLQGLEDNGMLRIEEHRFLGLIPYKSYDITRTTEQGRLVKRLKEIVLSGEKRPDPDLALQISLLAACGSLKGLFEREERAKAHETLKKINKGGYFSTLEPFEKEVQKTVRKIIAASRGAGA